MIFLKTQNIGANICIGREIRCLPYAELSIVQFCWFKQIGNVLQFLPVDSIEKIGSMLSGFADLVRRPDWHYFTFYSEVHGPMKSKISQSC